MPVIPYHAWIFKSRRHINKAFIWIFPHLFSHRYAFSFRIFGIAAQSANAASLLRVSAIVNLAFFLIFYQSRGANTARGIRAWRKNARRPALRVRHIFSGQYYGRVNTL
jgi:hypothetical protein